MLSREYRQQKAAEILLRDFGLRSVPRFDPHNQILICFGVDQPNPDFDAMERGEPVEPWPAAIVSGPGRDRHSHGDSGKPTPWGVLAPWPLQGRILEALNGHA